MENINQNKGDGKNVGTWIAKGFATAVLLFFSFFAWLILMLIVTISSNVAGWQFDFLCVVLPAALMISLDLLISSFLWVKNLKTRKIVIIICGCVVAICALGLIILVSTASLRPEYANWM